ncbi:MAG TPA: AraC family transcriptional regulator ligand-binding domain-containing protein [Streptosporangiaceae bacterium]|nr:AraC family transcriptional regulator ligand-binding domain-containing protein [Streptosporangiaceae bacterium]
MASRGGSSSPQTTSERHQAGSYTVDPTARVLLADLGVSVAGVLRRAALPADLLEGRPVLLTPGEYYTFWRAFEAEYGGDNLPIAIGNALSVEVFNPLLFAAMCSPNLAVAARRIAEYKKLIGPVRVLVAESAGETTVELRWSGPATPPRVLATTEIVFWVAMTRIATRTRVCPIRATMPQPPEDKDAYRRYLGIEILPGQVCTVGFSTHDAARPFLTANEAMWERFEPSLRRRRSDLAEGTSLTQRVRSALLELLPAGTASMQAVARDLTVSTRTLQRRLRSEGTTFQVVLAGVREELARHYLADGSMGMETIAFLLGYQDQSSFCRAFASWTGYTPNQVRSGAGQWQTMPPELARNVNAQREAAL